MQLPQIHSNKSFVDLYLQSAEYVISIGQGNVVWGAGVELGRRDSSFSSSKVSRQAKPCWSESWTHTPPGTWLFLLM